MMRKLAFLVFMLVASSVSATPKAEPMNAFSFEVKLTLPGKPPEIFDAATGDISGWWDHTFSKTPKALVLEPRMGGSFMEVFDDLGNGARHAAVITCDRPKLIRFEGPLGLAGRAVQMVHTYSFEAVGNDSTRMTLSVQGQGAASDTLGGVVEGAWKHFLIERFKPYVEAGQHRQKK
jgi:hypothetical protein